MHARLFTALHRTAPVVIATILDFLEIPGRAAPSFPITIARERRFIAVCRFNGGYAKERRSYVRYIPLPFNLFGSIMLCKYCSRVLSEKDKSNIKREKGKNKS